MMNYLKAFAVLVLIFSMILGPMAAFAAGLLFFPKTTCVLTVLGVLMYLTHSIKKDVIDDGL